MKGYERRLQKFEQIISAGQPRGGLGEYDRYAIVGRYRVAWDIYTKLFPGRTGIFLTIDTRIKVKGEVLNPLIDIGMIPPKISESDQKR